MGAMQKLLQNEIIIKKLQEIGIKNRQAMFGAGQKPEDYQQGPTASQNFGIKAGGIASPNMQDQYARYLKEKKDVEQPKEKKAVVKAVEKKASEKKTDDKTKDNVELVEKTTKNKKPKMSNLNIYSKTLLS